MNKFMTFLLIILSTTSMLQATNAFAIKLGVHSPEATDTGFLIGIEAANNIDESLDVGLSIDWFQKEFDNKEMKDNYDKIPGITGLITSKTDNTTIYSFPLMGCISFKIPIYQRLAVNFNGGLGAETLYINYYGYDKKENKFKEKNEFAFGFCWRALIGLNYELGSRSELIAEVGYHSSKPSFDEEFTILGKTNTITYEYDMSGVLGRAGIRFYL